MNKLKTILLVSLFILVPSAAWAQNCETVPQTCTAEGTCDFLCGSCWTCDTGTNTCIPDPAICNDMSGGNTENQCRNAVCLQSQNINENPTGCDYTYDSANASQACQLCEPPPPGFDACGNGICEFDLLETCQSCPIDCEVPGFPPGTCPENDPMVLNQACQLPNGQIKFVTFTGPDYNRPFSGFCEDGDVCTLDQCIDDPQLGRICSSGQGKSCSADNADLCCARNCDPPADGVACGNQLNCDIDCLTPLACPFCGNNIIDPGEQCDGTAPNNCGPEGCNNATCQCNPPIVTVGVCTQGSGCGNNSGNAPGDCSGFTTIGKPKVLQFFNEYLIVWLLMLAIGSVWAFKRRWR